jgi:DNA-binding protein HU-beta
MTTVSQVLRDDYGLSKKDADLAVEQMAGAVKKALTLAGVARVAGLGSFKTVQRAQRQGRNPATGEPITIAARQAIKFTAAK